MATRSHPFRLCAAESYLAQIYLPRSPLLPEMAYSVVRDEDLAFHQAYSDYTLAGSDKERSAASLVLRSELERQALSLDEALKLQKEARTEEFARELAVLEAQFRQEVKSKEDATAMKKAVVELCISRIDSDPEEAALLCKAVLSWSVQWTPLNSCMGSPFSDQWKEVRDGYRRLVPQAAGRAFVRIGQMTPAELYRVSASAQQLLKKKGQTVPVQDLQTLSQVV